MKPIPLPSKTYDVLTCVGVTTYIEPLVIRDWCKVVKKGNLNWLKPWLKGSQIWRFPDNLFFCKIGPNGPIFQSLNHIRGQKLFKHRLASSGSPLFSQPLISDGTQTLMRLIWKSSDLTPHIDILDGYLVFTVKSAVLNKWKTSQDEFEKKRLWKLIHMSEPLHYLPTLRDPSQEKVFIFVYQNCQP